MRLPPDHDNPRVREGCILRLASYLLVPFGERASFDRFELVAWLTDLGIRADRPGYPGTFWVVDACAGPEPTDEVTVLRREGDDWVIGIWERGLFRTDHRYGDEGDACQALLFELVSHHATSMGGIDQAPHVTPRFREAILAALAEATSLVERDPGGG